MLRLKHLLRPIQTLRYLLKLMHWYLLKPKHWLMQIQMLMCLLRLT
ncbi:hypothetical protein AMCSP09_001935, partial [Streptococcus pneumoniae 2081074]